MLGDKENTRAELQDQNVAVVNAGLPLAQVVTVS